MWVFSTHQDFTGVPGKPARHPVGNENIPINSFRGCRHNALYDHYNKEYMDANPKPTAEVKISSLFDRLSQPARIQILVIIRSQPACVCHLVAALGLRQAAISQHLMALRETGWVTTRKQGRYVFYQLRDRRLASLIEQAASIVGIAPSELGRLSLRPLDNCPCPQCHPELSAEYSCSSLP